MYYLSLIGCFLTLNIVYRSIYSSDSIFNESVLNELARVSLSEAEFDKLSRPIKVVNVYIILRGIVLSGTSDLYR